MMKQFMPIIFLLLNTSPVILSLDPLSWGMVAGAGVFTSFLYSSYDQIKCVGGFSECCSPDWVVNNFTQLEGELEQHVFGQHLVHSVVSLSLRSHVSKRQPSKALVLSFHGETGVGKNYVAQFVAESLYAKGLNSKFVHLFIATVDFPDDEKLDEYKLQLQDWIRGNVSQCAQTLFIFDEVDKMPVGLLDAVKAFVDYHKSIGGVDFRRSIFIFLSNTGGRKISETALQFWKRGQKREELKRKDLEGLIAKGAFSEDGGLHHANVIEKSLVDHFVPFLPIERRHVKQCILVETEKHLGKYQLNEEEIEGILDEYTYWPPSTPLFSTRGCKNVEEKVDVIIMEKRMEDGEEDDGL